LADRQRRIQSAVVVWLEHIHLRVRISGSLAVPGKKKMFTHSAHKHAA
jgi:hypothetical protein